MLKTNVKQEQKSVEIKLTGELDFGTVNDFEVLMMKLEYKYERYVIDFSELTFIDSAGIGILLKYYNIFKAKKRQIFFSNLRPKHIELLKVLKIYTILENDILD